MLGRIVDGVRYRWHMLRYRNRPRGSIFEDIFRKNLWRGRESRSGQGSDLDQTAVLRTELAALLARHGVRRLLDAPCGDFHWMKDAGLEVEEYTGVDIVPELIAANATRYGGARRTFQAADICSDPLPCADLVLCRDCFNHLSFSDIFLALRNLKRSGSRFLLATTYPGVRSNRDVRTGDWRPLDLEAPPFSFPPPRELLKEGCTEAGGPVADKSLGLWELAGLGAADEGGR